MPKARKTRSRCSRSDSTPTTYSQPPLQTEEQKLEWDQAICPICMECPHNAVLLRCSSWDKGCRPFLCNTGARHSDCLGQFYKSNSRAGHKQAVDTRKLCSKFNVNCPFCRGHVLGWEVDEPARKHMNSKPKNCSSESCEFSGTYPEMRKHVRSEHPLVRPREVDTLSWESWTMYEQERDEADLESVEEGIREILANRSAAAERWTMFEQRRHFTDFLNIALPVEEEEGVGEIRVGRSAESWREQFPYVLRVVDGMFVLYNWTQSMNGGVVHDPSRDIPMQHLSQRGLTNSAEVQGDTAASVVSATRDDAEGSNQTSRPGTGRDSSARRGTSYRRTRRRNQ